MSSATTRHEEDVRRDPAGVTGADQPEPQRPRQRRADERRVDERGDELARPVDVQVPSTAAPPDGQHDPADQERECDRPPGVHAVGVPA